MGIWNWPLGAAVTFTCRTLARNFGKPRAILEVDTALEISTACKTFVLLLHVSLIDPRGRLEGLIMQNAPVPAFARPQVHNCYAMTSLAH